MSAEGEVHIEAVSTLAVIAASHEPLLFLDDQLRVIAASTSFCRAFGIDPRTVAGATLPQLGNGEWGLPQLAELLKATASGAAAIDAYEADLVRPGHNTRLLLLHAHVLDDEGPDHTRLLLAVTDVTDRRADARQKDDLLREKAILLREVQHRVANSLQIVASVLMQSARRVQSDEARGHLEDAHSRVMSIAAVQRQLSMATLGEVAIRPYFAQLCNSLGASMIRDRTRVSIEVSADDNSTSADTSISLGLIVTELVINALKHAFPDQRHGTIKVDYRGSGPGWTLSVSDNGIGMPNDPAAAKPGLGTGIIEALARQLEARVEVDGGPPGVTTSIVHP
jgi:two-component sensor histidine kinase